MTLSISIAFRRVPGRMNRARLDDLEVLCRLPEGTVAMPWLLFVPRCLPPVPGAGMSFFCVISRRRDTQPTRSPFPATGSRGRAYLDSFPSPITWMMWRKWVAKLSVPPVLISHSMGGMVLQKYLESTWRRVWC